MLPKHSRLFGWWSERFSVNLGINRVGFLRTLSGRKRRWGGILLKLDPKWFCINSDQFSCMISSSSISILANTKDAWPLTWNFIESRKSRIYKCNSPFSQPQSKGKNIVSQDNRQIFKLFPVNRRERLLPSGSSFGFALLHKHQPLSPPPKVWTVTEF